MTDTLRAHVLLSTIDLVLRHRPGVTSVEAVTMGMQALAAFDARPQPARAAVVVPLKPVDPNPAA